MTFQIAGDESADWARANPRCTREEFERRVADCTAAHGPRVGYHFREVAMMVLRVVRRAA